MTQPRVSYHRLAEHRLGLRALRDVRPTGPKVLCFPHAGGQSLAFRELTEALPGHWSVWGVDLPAHGWAAGPALTEIPEMAEFCLRHLPSDVLADAIILGHSLGGCVAFEVATRLVAQGTPPPALILSGTRPPNRIADYESFVTMDDARLLECLISIGGIPGEWSTEPDLFDHFKEAIRADLVAFEHFAVGQPLTAVPALILAATADVVCRPEHSFEWSRYCPDCRVEIVRDGHLFIQTQADWVADRLVDFASGRTSQDS